MSAAIPTLDGWRRFQRTMTRLEGERQKAEAHVRSLSHENERLKRLLAQAKSAGFIASEGQEGDRG